MKKNFLILILICCACFNGTAQTFSGSNLPIVIINTDGGVPIVDDPRVLANMKIIHRGGGERNYLSDQSNPEYLDFTGRIEIEIRGSSSQELPKKQYGFSTLYPDNVTKNNISLLGMPPDNDWILNGLAFDAALMRDYINYNLARRMGNYASRTIYCEVMLNGQYNGLYILEEKMKQGEARIDIKKLSETDLTIPDITGGYIVKADKTGGDPVAWKMTEPNGNTDVTFIMDHPKPEKAKPAQVNYIKNEFFRLSYAARDWNNSFIDGIPAIIDVPSFIDFMLLNEFASNPDAYQFSTYFHKDRKGKIRAGPIWDMNLTFGNDIFMWGYDRSKTDVWQFMNGFNDGPVFWKDLFNNPVYKCILSERWETLSGAGGPMNATNIERFIDSTAMLISEAAAREHARWKTVGNFSSEVEKMKTWIRQRSSWLSSRLGYTGDCTQTPPGALVINRIMYNPEGTGNPEFIEIVNTSGKSLDASGVYFRGTGLVYQFPAYTLIPPHTSVMLTNDYAGFFEKYGYHPFGEYERKLANEGQDIVLADGFGNTIDRVRYSPFDPWPDADGNGKYLELTSVHLDNSDPANWIAVSNNLVSTGEIEENSILVFPNPVESVLTVRTGDLITSAVLTDLSGRVVRTVNPGGAAETVIDVLSLDPGLYFLRIHTSSAIITRKIVKR